GQVSLETIGEITIPGFEGTAKFLRTNLSGTTIPLFMVEHPYFDRKEIYGDYPDNHIRYALFSKAVLEGLQFIPKLNQLLKPNLILHCNDWPTALIPTYLELTYPHLKDTVSSLLTIHNMAHEGEFDLTDLVKLALMREGGDFNKVREILEFAGRGNLLKAGIITANDVGTVSRGYALEIQGGHWKLQNVLRRGHVWGIHNGINTNEFDPETDPYLTHHYNISNFKQGKKANKAELWEKLAMGDMPDKTFVVGIVSRLSRQKGFGQLMPIFDRLMKKIPNLYFFVGGKGEESWIWQDFQKRYPDRIFGEPGKFAPEEIVRLIYAGSDAFMVPSLDEPCGLTPLIAMRYGTVPLVRRVGGLRVIYEYDPINPDRGSADGLGFGYDNFDDHQAIFDMLMRAAKTYKQKMLWNVLVENCMRRDVSWDRAAKFYASIYEGLVAKIEGGV
ncbi:MAG: glycogen/starch synthase, partial [bacterium]